MKTINDLMQLIAKEIELNEGHVIKYTFSIDTDNKWLTMKEHAEFTSYKSGDRETEKNYYKTIINLERFDTPERLQLLYWTVYCNGRSAIQKSGTEL